MSKTIVVDREHNISNECSRSFQERKQELDIQDRVEYEALRRDRKSAFDDFVQTNLNPMIRQSYRALIRENSNAALVWDFLVERMGPYNSVMCSMTVIQEALGISKSTVIRAIRTLELRGFIFIKKSSTSNVYLLNNNIVWKSWGNNMQYCEFPGNIVLSKSEQQRPERHTRNIGKKTPRIELDNNNM